MYSSIFQIGSFNKKENN